MTRALGFTLALVVAAAAAPAQEAMPAPATDGFIYGTVTTRGGGSYTGVLRWDDEEAFWDDLFHSAKSELPWFEKYADQARADDTGKGEDREWWEVFGRKLAVTFGADGASRVVAVRFGDLLEVRPSGGDAADLVLKSGATLRVEGYSNDVGATIRVLDASLGQVEVPWRKVESLRFAAAPAGVDPGATRLHGTVATDAGTFTGFVQWDLQECLSTDELDGESADGDMSIEMGRIARIERRSRRASTVVLVDGRELVLEGTNDVNDDNRGIVVEDARFGRVEVPWQEFRSLALDPPGPSGRGYDDYRPAGGLRGVVETRDGARHEGRLVLDLDEAEGWEMLDGSADDLDYTIPFGRVRLLEPDGRRGARVTLDSGHVVELEGSHDVSEDNDGVVVIAPAGETYVPWAKVQRISFEAPSAR